MNREKLRLLDQARAFKAFLNIERIGTTDAYALENPLDFNDLLAECQASEISFETLNALKELLLEYREIGITDSQALEYAQKYFDTLLMKFKSGDTSSETLNGLRDAGKILVKYGQKVYGSASEQTGKNGILDSVVKVFEEIRKSLDVKASIEK